METTTGEICCRLCFCSDGNFLNIFNDVPSVFGIAELLKKYFQDEVKLSDPLPNIICSDCWRKTESFHEFHEKVLSEREQYLNLHLDDRGIKTEPESVLVAEVTGGQFDEFDVIMCVDPITVKSIHFDNNEDNVPEEAQPSLLDCSLKEDDELSAIDDNGSNLDDYYDCIVKTDYQYQSDSWLGKDEDFEDDDDDAPPEPESSSLPTNTKELSTSQIQAIVTKHFDMNCEKCDTKFSGFYEAKSHYQFAHNIARGYVKCCDLKLKEHKDYRSHVLWHLNPNVFDCLICGSTFKTLKSYHAHKHLHKNRALKRFICDICDASFPFKQKLERHIMQVHAAKKKYFCEECGHSFRTEKQFNIHNWYVHSGLDTQLTAERIEEFIRTKFDMECELKPCEKVFESLHDAKQHYSDAHNISNGWIKCCNNKFNFNKGINEHIAWHINPTVFQCVECGQLCNSRNNLKKHMMAHKEKRHARQTYLEHEDEDLFECEYCHKTFLKKSKLIEHMKFIHEPEIQKKKEADLLSRFFDMTCDKCENIFESLEEALTHYNQIHDDRNGYIKCCSLQFSDTSLAKDHLKWHLDPDIFKCNNDECDEKFPTRKDLKSHNRAVHPSRSFICHYCGKSFRAKQKVQKHMLRVHVNVKMKHRCGICKEKFKAFKQLHTHFESTHPDDLNNILIDTKNIPLLDLNDERMKAAIQKFVDQTCDICHIRLDTLADARIHYMYEHKKRNGYFKCCKSKIKGEMALINHLNWHLNPNIFRCRLCLKIFGSRISIKAHIKKHEALQTKRFSCSKCSDIFPTIDDYRSHMETKHCVTIPKRIYPEDKSTSNPLGDPVKEEDLNFYMTPIDMTCDMDGCTTEFTSLSNARAHYSNVHNSNGYIKCCDMKLRFQIDLKDHISWHKNPASFRCKCGRDYKSSRALSRHAIEFHSATSSLPKCAVCKKRFNDKTELDEHVMLHKKRPKFSCPEKNCYKTFFKEGFLKIHRERYHNPAAEKKNYICEICGAETFKTFVQLKSHLRQVHRQGPQKPKQKYQCDICLKFYSSQGSLYTHKLTHNSEIHKCTLCEKVSPNAAALVCHMNAVHVEKKLKCTLCDKSFKLAPALKDHIATHLNNKQWKCDYCDLEFYCRPNMYKHRKQIHRAEWEADKARKEAERNKL